jgi:hypothetical protein
LQQTSNYLARIYFIYKKGVFMTTTNTISNLTTIDENLYVGMTLRDAKEKNLDISLFNSIDELDGKRTGTLSKEDIIQHRDVECGKKASWGLVGTVATVTAALCGGWGLAALGAISSGSLFYKCESQDAITDKYR